VLRGGARLALFHVSAKADSRTTLQQLNRFPFAAGACLQTRRSRRERRPIESKFAKVLRGVVIRRSIGVLQWRSQRAIPVYTAFGQAPRHRGPVLGLFEQAHYDQAALELEPGDLLCVFNDGITEALNVAEEEFDAKNRRGFWMRCFERCSSSAAE
jgi:hypothetical protein